LRAVVQRVSRAQVTIHGEITGKIGHGLLVFLGVAKADTRTDADYLVGKILGLRVFEDPDRKMNLSLTDTHGAVLAVSQFTLYGDVRRGKRPSFDEAAPPEMARELYEYFVSKIREAGFVSIHADMALTVDAAHRSGAVALIAHPGRREQGFTYYDIDLLDKVRAEVPLDGIEVYHPYHNPDMVETYREYARKHRLLVSTGSDSHSHPGRMPIKHRAELSRELLERVGIHINI